MKIIYITSDYLEVGGISQHIENLSENISKYNEVCILYINTKYPDKLEIEGNKKIYFLSGNKNKFLRFIFYPIKKIIEIINIEKPDIIHIHTLFETIRILKKISNIPIIFTNHSSSYLKMYNNSLIKNIVLKNSLKKFDFIISPSTELHEKTINNNKIMIPNGVDTKRFSIDKRENIDKIQFLKNYGINLKNIPENIFISTRRLENKNGIYDFLEKNIDFIKSNNCIYIIIGYGQEYNKIKNLIEIKNASNIYMLGKLENKHIENFYFISDYTFIPSKMEAISISALEAMASGSIVIANNVGGLSEIIKDTETGLFLDNLDLNKTLNKNFDKNYIINNSNKFVNENYSWNIITEKTIDLYKKVLK